MRRNKLIDTLRVRSHLWRSCFVKWCGGVFGIWGVVVSFISLDDLGLNSTALRSWLFWSCSFCRAWAVLSTPLLREIESFGLVAAHRCRRVMGICFRLQTILKVVIVVA